MSDVTVQVKEGEGGGVPEGWVETNLVDLCSKIGSGATPRGGQKAYIESGVPLIRSMNIHFDRIKEDGLVFIDEQSAEKLKAVEVFSGDVLLNITGASIGRVNRATDKYHGARVNQHVAIIRPVLSDCGSYFKYYLSTPKLQAYIHTNEAGATRQALTKEKIENFLVPLPPLAEQKQIAAQLDQLLAQVERTKARLDVIPTILKRFRQSVLAAAVSGRLTEEWRGKDVLQWDETSLKDVAVNIVDCPHSTPKWSESGKYCVRTTAFNPFLLDLSEQGFVSDEIYAERIQRLRPEAGDILYSREGTVGIACQIPEGIDLCLGQRMVLIRSSEVCDSRYLTIVLNSEKITSIVRSKTVGSTVPRVNMKDIRSYPIPVPSSEEQTQIVKRVEQLFSFADQIEARVNQAQSRVNQLSQSILAKAFRGELTAQWRAENPALISGENSAEALLAKIKATQAALKPVKKTRARKNA